MNRALDYGFIWVKYKENDVAIEQNNENIIFQQLNYFHEKEKKKKGYIKALYLHHLLDFFKETYVNIRNIDLVYEKFLQDKVLVEISDSDGLSINFQDDINEIFKLIRENKEEVYNDLKGEYLLNLKKSKNQKE